MDKIMNVAIRVATKTYEDHVDFILPSTKRQYLEIIEKFKDPSIDLTFIPSVVSFFENLGVSPRESKNKLLQLSKEGVIELRPESGLGRLLEEDKEKCIKLKLSYDEYILSWINVL